MEYTEDQKEQFKQQFASKRRRQFLLMVPVVPVVLLFVLADDRGRTPLIHLPPAFIFVGLIVIVGAIANSFMNWRCPAYGKYLGRSLGPNCCSKCGVALR